MTPSHAAGAQGARYPGGAPTESEIRTHVAKLLTNRLFARSARMTRFLSFAVDQALMGEGDALKEYLVGVEVFDRGKDFDPRIDPIVRVEARRLRAKLKSYYASAGRTDAVMVLFPKGAYAPVFRARSIARNGPRRGHAPSPVAVLPFASLAVLPFTNATEDPDNEYLSDGIAESIINRLSQTKLKVAARASAFRLKQEDPDPIACGQRLKVAAVVTGRITRQGDNLSVQAELTSVTDGTQIWGDKFVRPLEQVQQFEQEIARMIADKLHLRLTQAENTQLAKTGTSEAEAYKLYLQGHFHLNKFTGEGFQKAIECFNAAVARDPGYARAYSGFAHASAIMAVDGLVPPRQAMPSSKTAALKALSLDDNLAEAHTSLGIVKLFGDWDWPGAESEFRRAMALDPCSSDALHFFSHYLEATGRPEEAVSVMRRAVDLDPLSLIINSEYGHALYTARRFEEAAAAHRETYDMDPSFYFAAIGLAADLERLNRAPEAVALLESVPQDVTVLMELAAAYAAAGQRDRARTTLARAREISPFADPFELAMAYAELGDYPETFRWLEKGYQEGSTGMTFIKVEPKFDPLRQDPRFVRILDRMKL